MNISMAAVRLAEGGTPVVAPTEQGGIFSLLWLIIALPALGAAVIESNVQTAINDGTSTKQMTTAASGTLLAAVDIPTLTYMHACLGDPCPVKPVADFTGSPTTGTAPLAVKFTDTSTNSPTSWSWSFGDGATSTAHNPVHQYADPGTYTVTLTATVSPGDPQAGTPTGQVQFLAGTTVLGTADLAGGTAVFTSNAFERRFRDIHTVSQQLQGRDDHFESVGKFLLGLEPDTTFL